MSDIYGPVYTIGDIDIGKTIIELQFQSKLNALLIESILNLGGDLSQDDIEELKVKAAAQVNAYYGGKEMITYTPPKNKKNKPNNTVSGGSKPASLETGYVVSMEEREQPEQPIYTKFIKLKKARDRLNKHTTNYLLSIFLIISIIIYLTN